MLVSLCHAYAGGAEPEVGDDRVLLTALSMAIDEAGDAGALNGLSELPGVDRGTEADG